MADAHAHPPLPVTEPVRAYAPGSSEKVGVQTRLAQLSDARTHIPMVIAGEALDGKDRATLRSPHRKDLVIGEYPMAETHDVEQAIDAALQARPAWAATPYHERAAVFLRAAALLSGAYRDTINAATMLGQSKTIFQAEIDAACELCDFWRFNPFYAQELYQEQPLSDHSMWNQLEYRPLEGFVYAVTPFNFTSIGGNLPTAPALMGATVIWKPASSAMLSAYTIVRLLEAAGLPPG